MNRRSILILFLACNSFIVEILARPNHEQVQSAKVEKLDVQDTDDEFIIKKPSKVDPKYKDFLDELYRKDNVKNTDNKTKAKREAEAAAVETPKAAVDNVEQYVIPEKPQSGVDATYDKFISELYSHDAEKQQVTAQQQTKLHRQKRMLIFRPLFAYKKSELKRQEKEKSKLSKTTRRPTNPNRI